MNEINLPDDIHLKSLKELTTLADKIIENLENKKDLENSIKEYQKLLKLNTLIEKKFQTTSKEISENTKSLIKDITAGNIKFDKLISALFHLMPVFKSFINFIPTAV